MKGRIYLFDVGMSILVACFPSNGSCQHACIMVVVVGRREGAGLVWFGKGGPVQSAPKGVRSE